MPLKNWELLQGEDLVQFRGVLQSSDGGRTWMIIEQESLVNAEGNALSVDLPGLMLEVAKNTDIFSFEEYEKFRDLAEEYGWTDNEAMAQLLSFWYTEKTE